MLLESEVEPELLVLIRQALSVPEGDLSFPVPGYIAADTSGQG